MANLTVNILKKAILHSRRSVTVSARMLVQRKLNWMPQQPILTICRLALIRPPKAKLLKVASSSMKKPRNRPNRRAVKVVAVDVIAVAVVAAITNAVMIAVVKVVIVTSKNLLLPFNGKQTRNGERIYIALPLTSSPQRLNPLPNTFHVLRHLILPHLLYLRSVN